MIIGMGEAESCEVCGDGVWDRIRVGVGGGGGRYWGKDVIGGDCRGGELVEI